MNPLSSLLASLRMHWIPLAEVRAEAWALGSRHRGQPLEGAREELRATGITLRRAVLLKAVIRSLVRRPKR